MFVHPDIDGPADPTRPGWWEWVNGYPARMQSAYLSWLAFGRERWPTLRVCFAMLGGGGPFQLERLARRGVDVRSVLGSIRAPTLLEELNTSGNDRATWLSPDGCRLYGSTDGNVWIATRLP